MRNELHWKMAQVGFLMKKKHMMAVREGGFDNEMGQGRILAALKMKDGIQSRELAFVLGMSRPGVSELLGKLEESGYITREQIEADKRGSIIKLTEKGQAATQKRHKESIFACLDEDEQKTFGGYLDRIAEALKAKLGLDDEQMAEMCKHGHGPHGCHGKHKRCHKHEGE